MFWNTAGREGGGVGEFQLLKVVERERFRSVLKSV